MLLRPNSSIVAKNEVKFFQKFTNHAHNGSVKAVACSPNGLLVSGASDEICNLINLKKSQEMGNLIEHEGAITELEFYKNKYLFSASEDASICCWNMATVSCDKKLKGHRQAINSISVHPSGKLMLSAGRDKTVRTWNLIKGRLAFVTNLREAADLVRWSPGGQHFLLAYGKRVDVYDVTTCGIVNTIECEPGLQSGITCVAYLDEQRIVIGQENGQLAFYNALEKQPLYTFQAHDRRVKQFVLLPEQLLPSLLPSQSASKRSPSAGLVSISSDGLLRLWLVGLEKRQFAEKLAEHNVNCRLNCVAFYRHAKNDQ